MTRKHLGWILGVLAWSAAFFYAFKTEPKFSPGLYLLGSLLLLTSDIVINSLGKVEKRIGFSILAFVSFAIGPGFVLLSVCIQTHILVGSLMSISIMTFFRIRDRLEKLANIAS